MKRNIFLMVAAAVSIMLLGSCNSEVADDANASVATIDTTHCTTFVIKETPTTRVSITGHVPNGGAVVNWIPDDKLWLRTPADARIGSMGNNLTGVSAWAKFYFPAGYNDATYQVNYLGHTTRTDGRHVTIHPSQWQGVPNNTDHLQYVGDCAEGVAYRDANKAGIYNLTLRHLPAYLCILPYCNNEVIRPGAKVTKIVVRSDNAITGTFDVAASKFAAGTNLGTQIENALNGGNGFSLENNVPNQALNAAYFVIMPGVHTLSIDYYYTSPQMSLPMRLTKRMAARDYRANTMTDIYANLNALNFGVKYYMWDAAEDVFAGVPQYIGAPLDIPTSNADSRWYNELGGYQVAQRSAKSAPNIAQASWYTTAVTFVDKYTQWTINGETGVGGMWIKKLSAIAGQQHVTLDHMATYDLNSRNAAQYAATQISPTGSIYSSMSNSQIVRWYDQSTFVWQDEYNTKYYESVSDYFFLPAAGDSPWKDNKYDGAGYYFENSGAGVTGSNRYCYYWLSSAQGDKAYVLGFVLPETTGYKSPLSIKAAPKNKLLPVMYPVQ